MTISQPWSRNFAHQIESYFESTAMNRIEKYIVPWDFSKHSTAALQYALQHFRGHAIKVICVLEPPVPYQSGLDWGSKAQEKAANKCREDFYDQAKIPHDRGVKFEIAFGDPAEEICRFANESGADYIVMSTHGKTGLKKLMMGSVTQQVISRSNCPIVLLPAKWFEQHYPPVLLPSAEILEPLK